MRWEEEGTTRQYERRREASVAVAVAWRRMCEARGHVSSRRRWHRDDWGLESVQSLANGLLIKNWVRIKI